MANSRRFDGAVSGMFLGSVDLELRSLLENTFLIVVDIETFGSLSSIP